MSSSRRMPDKRKHRSDNTHDFTIQTIHKVHCTGDTHGSRFFVCFGVVRWNKFHPHRTLVLMLCFAFWCSYYHAKHTYVLYLVISHICVRYPWFSTMRFNVQYKPRWFQGFLAIWWRANEAHSGISYWPTENSFSHEISCLSWIKFSLKWTHIIKTLKTLWTWFEQESTNEQWGIV